jgi:hypothetical protein
LILPRNAGSYTFQGIAKSRSGRSSVTGEPDGPPMKPRLLGLYRDGLLDLEASRGVLVM